MMIMMPYWLYADTKLTKKDSYSCTILWPKESVIAHRWFWINFQLTMGFILPIIVMGLCYISLLKNLFYIAPQMQEQNRRPIRKVTLMVFMVTLVFVVCWIPYHVLQFVHERNAYRYITTKTRPSNQEFLNSVIFNTLVESLVFISSCINPFIYAISSRNFSKYPIVW